MQAQSGGRHGHTFASRPDLLAHREALRLPASKVVENLVEIIGRKLTAYIGGVNDARAVDRWIAGGAIYGDAESRLRFAFQVARALANTIRPLGAGLADWRESGTGRQSSAAADARQ